MTATPVYVADGSALTALFGGDPVMLDVHLQADEGSAILILPSLAVLQATIASGAGEDAWQAILFPSGTHVADLRATTGIALGRAAGGGKNPPLDELQILHTAWETEQLGRDAWVLTTTPAAYRPYPVRVIDINLN
ncbi:hypothetical protein [Phytomonospora endophytica]|uniref:Uncharacterized protein n=1 Tax=Phytomonospora endophytica TaxID=714109 RepID=A0A841FRZ5_9ACTN|nr:hypothetical protein [Phytomonospora endophytica]MBB6035319.1 hypothetical protein [Phytomonospora endophytica]GIG63932.1 hypothetical protein Pen01_02270 [Phytomonospora endophytica]